MRDVIVDDSIRYLNTDLELTSVNDLTPITEAFKARGAFILHFRQDADQLWYATIEIIDPCGPRHEPEKDISDLLTVVESLDESVRTAWAGCSRLEFDIGYDCGSKPRPFHKELSNELLRRIAAVGASLRITLYPPASENS